ncbi:hypothetical protein [Simkania sp.]|uniref:hypothetical protein n=1 Tax=Simkania sp. TaxID=34094 RepID=UPI003B51D110
MLHEKNSQGACPAMQAAFNRHFHLLEKLIDRDETLMQTRDNDNSTLLHGLQECPKLYKKIVEYDPSLLHEKSEYSGDYPIHSLGYYDKQYELLKWVVEKDPAVLQQRNKGGRLLIHQFVQNQGDYEGFNLFLWLIEQDPTQLEAKDDEDFGLIHHAFCASNFQVIKWLLEKDPSCIFEKTKEGMLPIHFLSWYGDNQGFIRWFFEKYPEQLLEKSPSGDLPIHLACQCGYEELAMWILEQAQVIQTVS